MTIISEDHEDDDRAQMRRLKEQMEAKQGLTAQELKRQEEEALRRKQEKLAAMFAGESYEIQAQI